MRNLECGVPPLRQFALVVSVLSQNGAMTNKTYTDVAHLPLAEAAEMLPQFLKEKGTQKETHETGAAGHKPSLAVASPIRAEGQESIHPGFPIWFLAHDRRGAFL